MIEIALTVCSVLHGAQCRDLQLTFEDENQLATPYACMFVGQSEIAKWCAQNVNWSVSKWTCRAAGRYGKA